MSAFNILRNLLTVFHSGCTIQHSHRQDTRIPISLHAQLHLLFFFLNNSQPNKHVWYLIMILCVSLMFSDTEHLRTHLSAICVSSVEKWLLISFAHLKSSRLRFPIELKESLVCFRYQSLIRYMDYNDFSPFDRLYFSSIVSFVIQKCFNLIQPYLSILLLLPMLLTL